jgi:hypothetical protein
MPELLIVSYYHLHIDYIHTGTQVTHLLYFDCKIGDFQIDGLCLFTKKFVYLLSYNVFFGDFLNYALKTNPTAVHVLQ